jgi:integrase
LADRPSTANNVTRIASIFFNYAIDMEYIHANPATRISPMKIGTLKRWEVEEIMKVIALGHRRISTAVALAYYTGQRESDVLKMKWTDIKDNCLHVTQSKTGQVLEILIAKELRDVLDGLTRDGDYIVGGSNLVSGPAFRNQFTRVIRKIGLNLPFHGIRKTVGCILAEKGSSVNEIAAMLGHKTLAMAALYTRQANSTKMIASAVTSLTSR